MPPEQGLLTGNINTNQEQAPVGREWVYQPTGTPTQLERENVIRTITIRQLSHGYIVEVGCQTFAIETASTLIAKLSEYILNPNATEQKHKEGKLF